MVRFTVLCLLATFISSIAPSNAHADEPAAPQKIDKPTATKTVEVNTGFFLGVGTNPLITTTLSLGYYGKYFSVGVEYGESNTRLGGGIVEISKGQNVEKPDTETFSRSKRTVSLLKARLHYHFRYCAVFAGLGTGRISETLFTSSYSHSSGTTSSVSISYANSWEPVYFLGLTIPLAKHIFLDVHLYTTIEIDNDRFFITGYETGSIMHDSTPGAVRFNWLFW